MRFCSVCRNLRTSKPLGCCCFSVVPHVASTCFACCPRLQQTHMQASMTEPLCPPSQPCLAATAFPTQPAPSRSCHCPWGGWGCIQCSAYWASCLPVLHLHYPDAAQDLVARLSAPAPLAPCLRAACRASEELQAAGWSLMGQQSTPPALHGPSSALRGYALLAHCQAAVHSQSGPFASRSFTTVPTCPSLAHSHKGVSASSWRPPCCLRAIRGSSGARLSFGKVRRAGLP